MGRGTAVSMFSKGQRVRFPTNRGQGLGVIVKLHKAGRQGVAEIKPADPIAGSSKKVSRRLQFVHKD